MGENIKCFIKGLPLCAVIAAASAAAAWLYYAASDYDSYYTALKIYCIGWFACCILSFYCGLLVVPRSLAIVFSFAGLVGFALVCAMEPDFAQEHPLLSGTIEAIPAFFFLFAWAAAAAAACRSEVRKIRLSSGLWLTVFLLLTFCWIAFHLAQAGLNQQRRMHLADAYAKAQRIITALTAWQTQHGSYPDSLDQAGITDDQTVLLYRGKRLHYFPRQSMYILTLEDPLLGAQKIYAYDTSRGGWHPEDPLRSIQQQPAHLFVGFLRQR
ncbi:MAG TPA: hypothetical protein PK052_05315 [Anaerohalosphaeraceae bacterium]|nr:hypothetical protein [Phycisphaerae bacterium]HOK94765.1 hypothetical protein [Anaerohalosphaeraceae bacterium]HOL31383.1 hypothetical protein [Anaerohalosphaeraceae bacterium]HPC64036.1 hypothetical protein [Anaerohalosphaeraceae bacterium]HPO70282.1 hypothetical protein [Anaerohalosphaeraceae bacterium]